MAYAFNRKARKVLERQLRDAHKNGRSREIREIEYVMCRDNEYKRMDREISAAKRKKRPLTKGDIEERLRTAAILCRSETGYRG
jgi:hypothetical protein